MRMPYWKRKLFCLILPCYNVIPFLYVVPYILFYGSTTFNTVTLNTGTVNTGHLITTSLRHLIPRQSQRHIIPYTFNTATLNTCVQSPLIGVAKILNWLKLAI